MKAEGRDPDGSSKRFARLWGRWRIPGRAAWSESVVLSAPAFDQDLRLPKRVEDREVQELVSELSIERLHVAVLPGTSGLDEKRSYLDALEPISNSVGRDDLPVPDHSTLSRRARSLDVLPEPNRPGGSIHRIVDSTGLQIPGECLWAAAKHGAETDTRSVETAHRSRRARFHRSVPLDQNPSR